MVPERLERGMVLLARWSASGWRPPPPFTLTELLQLSGFVAECRLLAVEDDAGSLIEWLAEMQQVLKRAIDRVRLAEPPLPA